MKLVKLDAIDSTNDYLKDLVHSQKAQNFTVVTAEYQNNGKGQMGTVWSSEKSKNIIMSMLVQDFIADAASIFDLNIAVSLAVIQSLKSLNVTQLSIKWPNDIMADNKKVGGILIENSFKSDGTIYSVIGLGLNVNQTNFENLPQASSISLVLGSIVDKDELLFLIIENIKKNIQSWEQNSNLFFEQYTNLLFKKDLPMRFESNDGSFFTGIIRGIKNSGRLNLENESKILVDFDIKEIKMIY